MSRDFSRNFDLDDASELDDPLESVNRGAEAALTELEHRAKLELLSVRVGAGQLLDTLTLLITGTFVALSTLLIAIFFIFDAGARLLVELLGTSPGVARLLIGGAVLLSLACLLRITLSQRKHRRRAAIASLAGEIREARRHGYH